MDPFSTGYQPQSTNGNNKPKYEYGPAQNLDEFFGDGIALSQYERQAEPQEPQANSNATGDLINLVSVE